MKNILKIVFVIIGTLIGAGFASGQEIYIFFFSNGINGLYGILISYSLMGIIIYKALKLIEQNNIQTYKDFLETIIKNKSSKVKFNIVDIVNIVINIFILITFFIMVAGFGAYFEQEFGINKIIGSMILSILCFIIFLTNIKGVIKANELIVPILIAFLFIVGMLNIKDIHFINLSNYIIKTSNSNFILDGILYCSYNSILLIPVLITLKNYIENKKQIKKVSILVTLISIILATLIFLTMIRINVDIKNLEMPIVYVVSYMSKIIKYIYGFIILSSIFTTAISLGTSFLQNSCKKRKSYTQIAVIMCISSIIISNFGFSNLVNLLYPIFGYIGIIQIVKLFTVFY